MIVGEALTWPYPERIDSRTRLEGKCSAPLEGTSQEASLLPRPDRSTEDHQTSIYKQNSYSPLKPRFYSPKDIPAHGFLEGETPSKNVSLPSLLHFTSTQSGAALPRGLARTLTFTSITPLPIE